MKALITGDIHLTDLPRDEYRWSIFPWLEQQASKHRADSIIVAGDLTDRKDLHPGRLVNRIVEAMEKLKRRVPHVYVIKGNHDYDQDPHTPFFRFADWFITDPWEWTAPEDFKVLLYPYVRGFRGNEWKFGKGYDLIVIHQTLKGAVASNGFPMKGAKRGVFRASKVGEGCVVISGDIHVPQRCGNVIYAGAPHPITFGDSYDPRVLLYDHGKVRSIRRRTIRKALVDVTADDLTALDDFTENDQVKIRCHLHRRDFPDWGKVQADIREHCDLLGLDVHSIKMEEVKAKQRKRLREDADEPREAQSHLDVFDEFCRLHRISPKMRQAGKGLL